MAFGRGVVPLLIVLTMLAGAAWPLAQAVNETPQTDRFVFRDQVFRAPDGDPGPTGYPNPGYWDQSEYMMGTVVVALILPESDGTLDPNLENWTAPEQTAVQDEVRAGLDWWEARAATYGVALSFNPIVVNLSVPTGCEPVMAGGCSETTWINSVMFELGYTTGNSFERMRAYNHALRTAYQTDWAFIAFVADSSFTPDGNEFIAHAFLGGPYLAMTYDNAGYGINDMDRVMAHETGHIFWATDEYELPAEFSGYLNIQETYLSGCLMDTASLGCVSAGTRGQIGWRDTDANGIHDILDTFPETTLLWWPPDANPGASLDYGVEVLVNPYPNSNSQDATPNDVTIVDIASVKYRLDGGPWLDATSLDGTYDQGWENATFTLPAQGDGLHTVDVCAVTTVGNWDPSCAQDTFTVDASPPTSSANALPTYTTSSTFTVTATASDNVAVLSVQLYHRFNGGGWTSLGSDTTAPYSWLVDAAALGGDGTHAFYTVALDTVNNAETAPAGPDASTIVDTLPPTSSLNPLASSFTTNSVPVSGNAADANGVASVALWYRRNGGSWISSAADTAAPWAWTFDAGVAGDGFYEFATEAIDVPGNAAAFSGLSEASTTVDTTAPASSLSPLPALTNNPVMSLTATASDTNGIASVDAFVRYEGGPPQSLGALTGTPYQWIFDASPWGDGTFTFYSLAVDGPGNAEVPPLMPDATTLVDTTASASSVQPLPPYTTTSVFDVDVIASDIVGVASVTLYASPDGVTWNTVGTLTSSPYRWSFDTAGAEGTYRFYSLSTDTAGNTESKTPAAEALTVVDLNAAVATIQPLPALSNQTSHFLSIAASDTMSGVTVVEVWMQKDGGGWTKVHEDFASPYGWTFDALLFGGDGLYEFYAIARDAAGLAEATAGAEAFVRVDASAPTSAVQPLPSYTTSRFVTVTVTATDALGINRVELRYRANGGAWITLTSDTTAPYTWTLDTAVLAGDAFYEFFARAVDTAGNTEPKAWIPEAATRVDTQLPTSSLDPLPSLTNLASFGVTAQAGDGATGSGVASVTLWVRKDGGIWGLLTPDVEAPYTWTFDSTTAGGDGLYDFASQAADVAGNAEPAPLLPLRTVRVDTTPPTSATQPLSPPITSANSVVLQASASDVSGVVSLSHHYRYEGGSWTLVTTLATAPWTWAFTFPDGDGLYEFTTVATDAAGNTELGPGFVDTSVLVDRTAPVAIADPLPALTRATPLVVTATATDTSGVISVSFFYRRDGGSWVEVIDNVAPWSISVDVAALGDGVYDFRTTARDAIGLLESGTSVEASTRVDRTTPVSEAGALAAYGSSASLAITATASDANVLAYVELWGRRDGGVYTLCGNLTAAPYAWTLDANAFGGEGAYEFYTVAVDEAGNREAFPFVPDATQTVDWTSPTVVFLQPGGAWLRAASVAFLWTASDAGAGIDGYLFSVDGGSAKSMLTTSWTETMAEGLHNATVTARDRAGNEASDTVAFRVDTRPPSLTFDEPAAGAHLTVDDVTVLWTATDATSGLAWTAVEVDGANVTSSASGTSLALYNLAPGEHTVRLSASDEAGNDADTLLAFVVEQPKPAETPPYLLYLLLLGAAVAAVLLILLLARRRRKKEEATAPRRVVKATTKKPAAKTNNSKSKSTAKPGTKKTNSAKSNSTTKPKKPA